MFGKQLFQAPIVYQHMIIVLFYLARFGDKSSWCVRRRAFEFCQTTDQIYTKEKQLRAHPLTADEANHFSQFQFKLLPDSRCSIHLHLTEYHLALDAHIWNHTHVLISHLY